MKFNDFKYTSNDLIIIIVDQDYVTEKIPIYKSRSALL